MFGEVENYLCMLVRRLRDSREAGQGQLFRFLPRGQGLILVASPVARACLAKSVASLKPYHGLYIFTTSSYLVFVEAFVVT